MKTIASHPTNTESVSHVPDTLFGIEWSVNRHQLIAGAAEHLLASKARTKVKAILAPLNGQTITDIAGWADQIKRRQPQPTDDPDTVVFLTDHRNDGNASWHYVDLPAGADQYSRERYPGFTNDEDVVQMIQASTQVLMGTSTRFSRLNALRLVVHLVGDVHQPLHVGCSYIGQKNGKDTLVFDPAKAIGLPSDQGGNTILLPTGGSGTAMHSYWDSGLPGHIDTPPADLANTATVDTNSQANELDVMIQKLLHQIHTYQNSSSAAHLLEAPAITPDKWAISWATESLLQARQAYKGISIQQKIGQKYKVNWEDKTAYEKRCTPIVSERLTAAARNLAKLLNTVLA